MASSEGRWSDRPEPPAALPFQCHWLQNWIRSSGNAAWRTHLVQPLGIAGVLEPYGLLAGFRFFSRFGFSFPALSQRSSISVGSVIFYNFVLTPPDKISKLPRHHIQIVLDIFITVLVHFSGGCQLVLACLPHRDDRSGFLLPRKRCLDGGRRGWRVWTPLVGYYAKFSVVSMPFVPSGLSTYGLYLSLTWFWVLLNSTVAIISAIYVRDPRGIPGAGGQPERLQNLYTSTTDCAALGHPVCETGLAGKHEIPSKTQLCLL